MNHLHCTNCHHPDANVLPMDDGYYTCDKCGHHEPIGDDEPLLNALEQHERWAHEHADYPGEAI